MDATILDAWKTGISQFNNARYWHAHESWECGWKYLQQPEKEYVQALIQSCAAFYLFIVKMRYRPAISLTQSALSKLQKSRSSEFIDKTFPRIEILGLEETLTEILLLSKSDALEQVNWEKYTRKLQAVLIEGG